MISVKSKSSMNGSAKQVKSDDGKKWQGGHVMVKDVGGVEMLFRARYEAKCPRCKETIELGQRVCEHLQTAKRTRWAHHDCDNPTRSALSMHGNSRGGEKDGRDDKAREILDTAMLEIERLGQRVSENVDDIKSVVKSGVANRVTIGEAISLIGELQEQVEILEKAKPRELVIKQTKKPDVKLKGVVHPAFDEVLGLATVRQATFLPGPTGSGKSHLAGQIAEALDLSFSCISCSAGMSESQLLGRMVPQGDHGQFEFLTTPFLEAYENGGVFLFDEIDAADSNVLLVINSALANGHMTVPSRQEKPVAKKHADFVCLAAGNTYGTGADRQYVGREQLDFATLSRFRMGTVEMDYDRDLETQLCPDKNLRERAWKYRDRINENRLLREMSTRTIVDSHKLMAKLGWTIEQIEAKWFQGWRADEVSKVQF